MVLSCLFIHQSRYCCKGILYIWLIFRSVGFGESRLVTIIWMGLSQSVEGFKRKTDLPRKKECCILGLTTTTTHSWFSSQLTCPADFRFTSTHNCMSYQLALVVKNSPANAGDIRDEGLILGLGKSPRGGHGNPLQYSCLENPMDRGAWWATVHRVVKSWTWLKWLSTAHSSLK